MGKIIIDERELKLILEKYRDNITDKRNWMDNVGTAGSLFLTIISSDFKDLWFIKAEYIRYTVWIITLYFLVKGCHTWLLNRKSQFSKDILYEKICEKSEIEKASFSIIVIKDEFNEYPNRFLVYDDGRWGCKLFLNFYMQNTNGEREKSNQLDSVSNYLKIRKEDMVIDYLFVKESTKYSLTAHKDKSYDFYYYYVKIRKEAFTDNMKHQIFEIEGRTYYWMSMDMLWKDRSTVERNSDVLRVVKNDTGLI